MRGATPPDIYDLELRESLFHGVRALRLIPEDQQKTMGRADGRVLSTVIQTKLHPEQIANYLKYHLSRIGS